VTGLGVDSDTGRYHYVPNYHWTGHVSVMGFSAANRTGADGPTVVANYLHYLSHHPATAKHLATKLAQRFVSDTPPATLVKQLASTYLAHDTAIIPVLRVLFDSREFRSSTGKKVRRPYEDLVATLRVLGYGPDTSGTDGLLGLYWMAEGLGQAPAGWPQPNGYPDVASAWSSAGGTLARWNSHVSLAAHWWPKTLVQPKLRTLLPATLPATHGALVDALAKRLVFRTLTPAHRAAVLTFLGRAASDPVTSTSEVVGWRLPYVVALILDSPYHWLR
jgi:uncharacterized protein (DUF1800 family)